MQIRQKGELAAFEKQYLETLKNGFLDPKIRPYLERIMREKSDIRVMDVGCGFLWTSLPALAVFFTEVAMRDQKINMVGLDSNKIGVDKRHLLEVLNAINPDTKGISLKYQIIPETILTNMGDLLPLYEKEAPMKYDIVVCLNYLPIDPRRSEVLSMIDRGDRADQYHIFFCMVGRLIAPNGLLLVSEAVDGPIPGGVLESDARVKIIVNDKNNEMNSDGDLNWRVSVGIKEE